MAVNAQCEVFALTLTLCLDFIEGFDPEDPAGGSLYQRAIVRAAVVDPDATDPDATVGYDTVWAYVYVEESLYYSV